MMTRKVRPLQGIGGQIPPLGMNAAAFLSHGDHPRDTATSHSRNALFFAWDFGNDPG